ncbi:MAG: thiamine phosphate synthase [Candidatus Spyradocola sp.]
MRCMDERLRLYAVTDRAWTGRQTLAEQVEAALRGGVTLVQLREKALERDAFRAEAREILALCHRYGVPLIINDDVELAVEIGADGVHVGQSDMRAGDVRARVGAGMIVGVTAKTVEQALAAQAAGADYLGSGAVFGTSTKADAKPMSLDTLRSICSAVDIPVVAIGGVNKGNLSRLAGTGVCGAAVVSGIFAAQDIEAECRELRALAEEIARKG